MYKGGFYEKLTIMQKRQEEGLCKNKYKWIQVTMMIDKNMNIKAMQYCTVDIKTLRHITA